MYHLEENQIQQFIKQGFVRIDQAFSRSLADVCRNILWQATGCDPHNQATWTQPVVRLGDFAQEPFRQAANTPILHAAFDSLVGEGNWMPRMSLGSFPVRFPSKEEPGDDGWHVDASFPGNDPNNYFDWRVNVSSRGRALLMLFLFSDVGEHDAPTRIRVGSHQKVAQLLAPFEDAGLSFLELAERLAVTDDLPQMLATGEAGTVYLCHPFLVHAAQPHHGTTPRFMAQPPLFPKKPFQLYRTDESYSPVEVAIRIGLNI